MDYIESQGKANPWKIYCSMDWYFYGLYILQKLLKKWSLYIYHYFKNHGLNIFRFPGLHGLLKEKTSFLKPFKILLKRL